MKLIVGLGNPGAEYERTRHNIGFLVLDELAKRLGEEFRNKRAMEMDCVESLQNENKVLLCKPQTYMNVSGRAVKSAMSKNGSNADDLLVIYDDADLPFGDIRFKESGSSAGHNGLQSIIDLFPRGTAIARIRIGIGRPPHPDMELDSFVLGRWSEREEEALPDIINKAADLAIEKLNG